MDAESIIFMGHFMERDCAIIFNPKGVMHKNMIQLSPILI
jgi:hypothetical protein